MATKLIIVSTKAGVTADYTNLNSAMAAVDGGTYFASGVFTALSSSDDITIRVVETADCGGNTTLSFGSTKPNSVLIEGSTICQNGDLSTLAKVTATANTTFNFGSGRPLNGEWVFRNLYIDLNGFRHAGSNAVVTATGSGATLTGSNLVVEGSRSNQLGYGFKSDTRNPSLTMNLYNCVVTDCATTAGDFIGFGAAGSNGNVRG
ncbi:MAG: hypothetical protein GY753_18880, partial [Gammaproteobacteria bacterium]|nr:hypothetical protein [Gammaproteobacteria bacterium]